MILLVSFLCRNEPLCKHACTRVDACVPMWMRVYPCGCVCARQHKNELRPPRGCRRRSHPHALRSPPGWRRALPALQAAPTDRASSACMSISWGDSGLAAGVSAAADASSRASQGRTLQWAASSHPWSEWGQGRAHPLASLVSGRLRGQVPVRLAQGRTRGNTRRTGAWQLPPTYFSSSCSFSFSETSC